MLETGTETPISVFLLKAGHIVIPAVSGCLGRALGFGVCCPEGLQWALGQPKKEESSRCPQGFSLWDPKPRGGLLGMGRTLMNVSANKGLTSRKPF